MIAINFGKRRGDAERKSVIYPVKKGQMPAVLSFTKWKKMAGSVDGFSKALSGRHDPTFTRFVVGRLSVMNPDSVPSVQVFMDAAPEGKVHGEKSLHIPPRLSHLVKLVFTGTVDGRAIDALKILDRESILRKSGFDSLVAKLAMGDAALNTIPVVELLGGEHIKAIRAKEMNAGGPGIRIPDVGTYEVDQNEINGLGSGISHELGILGAGLSNIQILAAAIGNPELADVLGVSPRHIRAVRKMADAVTEAYLGRGDMYVAREFVFETVVPLGIQCHNGHVTE